MDNGPPSAARPRTVGPALVADVAAAVAEAEPADAFEAGLAALAGAGFAAALAPGPAGPDERTDEPGLLPLVRRGVRFGALSLVPSPDSETASALASVLSLALDHRYGGHDPTALLNVGIAVGEARTFDDAFAVVLEGCLELSGADGATLVVWDASGERGVVRAGAGTGEPFVGEETRVGDNVASAALAARHPVVLHHETGDGLPGAFAESVAALACSCSVPLILHGEPLATLQAGWVETPSPAEVERAIALLQTVSSLTSLPARTFDERAHVRHEAVVDAVLDSVGEALWIDCAHLRLVNASARGILGLDGVPDHGPGDVLLRSLDGTDVPADERPAAVALRTRRPQRFRNRAVRADGVERILDGVAAPVVTGGGEVVGVVMSFRDVTEAHSSAARKDEFLGRLFESLPTAIALSSAETREVTSANRAFLELVGREDHEVHGCRPPYPWWPEGQELPPLTDGRDRVEWAYRRRDGSLVPVEITRVELESDERAPLATMVLATDLSERRRFEQQLVQTGKMAAIGELAAGVAHEINNPLFAILGLVEFLLKDAEPGSKAESRLQLIQQTGLEIKEIVRALLDFARERAEDVTLVSLRHVAEQTVDLVRRATSAKGIELVERYPDEEVMVEASPTQLKQVLLNLLTNARHALGDGGTVTIELAVRDGWATATVADDGPGVPPEVAARIFDPFFTTKRDLGGTGLGLSVSLGIAQTHGGDLSLGSSPGEGAAFTLRLPLAPGECGA